MTRASPFEKALRKILWDLRSYLGDVVVIGGWVPYLYREYGGFRHWNGRLALTAEVDVLVDRPLPPGERPPVTELLRNADFTPDPEVKTAHCAVWQNDPAQGEKVEFLVDHQGTARQLGEPVAVPGQREMAAIPLEGLGLLRRHTSTLRVPAGTRGGEMQVLDVRVPTLGAYAVNKASSFANRRPLPGDQSNPKRAKDLLYLSDLIAAGDEVIERIAADLAEIARTGRSEVQAVRSAASQLGLVLGDLALRARLDEVASMLVERDGGELRAARSDIEGHLGDLHELFMKATETRRKR